MKEELMHIVREDKKKLLFLTFLAVVAVLMMVVGSVWSDDKKETKTDTDTDPESVKVTASGGSTAAELEKALSSVNGVGDVRVVICREDSFTENYAYNEEISEKTGENGVIERSEKRELALTGEEDTPVVTSKKGGEIRGVLVVARGAENASVRKDLIDAVSLCLSVGKNRIEVTAMEEE